ncbi:MAG: deoxyribodipyrimidine photo-lyase [Bryobacteraceae bacterium]
MTTTQLYLPDRVSKLNDAPIRGGAKYVLYWAQMNRRVDFNHALAFAVELANERNLPVLFYEGLTCSYPHANDRLHTFILEGVGDTAARLRELGIGYEFYLRRRLDDPDDRMYKFASDAAAVVTDDYPTFVARGFNRRVPGKLDVACYVVDSSCIVPMHKMEKREWAAYTIRPKIRKLLDRYMVAVPELRVKVTSSAKRQATQGDDLPYCQIDHSVAPSSIYRGGTNEARKHLRHFLEHNLRRYAKSKNEPSANATSNLSPYLHFGHISSLEVALAVRDYAAEHKLIADEFLEELIVRRELAFNFARFTENPASIENLPEWAQQTLAEHARDKRDPVYSRDEFIAAKTHDPLWNATQKEMLQTGKIHGYYRMYWGKKILEWSRTPQEAVDTMVHIHDIWALDGRDPATYTNILWCLGLHDRPWPERPIFGKVRYMSYDGMKRKTDVDAYIREIEQPCKLF